MRETQIRLCSADLRLLRYIGQGASEPRQVENLAGYEM
jgi:hypothetical protein